MTKVHVIKFVAFCCRMQEFMVVSQIREFYESAMVAKKLRPYRYLAAVV